MSWFHEKYIRANTKMTPLSSTLQAQPPPTPICHKSQSPFTLVLKFGVWHWPFLSGRIAWPLAPRRASIPAHWLLKSGHPFTRLPRALASSSVPPGSGLAGWASVHPNSPEEGWRWPDWLGCCWGRASRARRGGAWRRVGGETKPPAVRRRSPGRAVRAGESSA